MEIQERFRRIIEIDPSANAIEFEGKRYTWGDLGVIAREVERILDEAGIAPFTPIAWIARNHPAMVGAAIGIISSGRMLAPVSPHQPMERIARELRGLRMCVVLGIPRDWTPEITGAVKDTDAIGLELHIGGEQPVKYIPGAESLKSGPYRPVMEGVVLERLSSGTTGPPKRIAASNAVMRKALALGARSEKNKGEEELTLKTSPDVQFYPYAHSAGLFRMLLAINQGRTVILFDRFKVDIWAEATKKYRPKVVSLVPAMINMIMNSDIDADCLSSLLVVRTGTAPLDPDVKQAFEERFGVPVLMEYGASEFVGGIAGWSLEDHKKYGVSKRGSSGRPRPDVELQVVDEDGRPLPTGEVGVLEVRSSRFGPDWTGTTDVASIDEDGFLYILGRADEAIIRGGFKVLPEKVAEALRLHPDVFDAAVLGVLDERLGEVPIAVIEPVPGKNPTSEELAAFARDNMPPYNVPAVFEVVEKLPRTPSLKIARPAVRDMFEGKYEFKVVKKKK